MNFGEWHKSTYSDGATNCVECAESPDAVRVRDTQHREHGHLEFPRTEWLALAAAIRSGTL